MLIYLRLLTGKKHLQTKLQCLQKVLETKFLRNKLVTGKTAFFVIDPFSTPYPICFNTGFWQGSFLWKCCVSILILLTKKRYSSFLEKVFIFQKIYFRVKVLKTFKIPIGCHIKTCQSPKLKAILKIPSSAFYALSLPLSVSLSFSLSLSLSLSYY